MKILNKSAKLGVKLGCNHKKTVANQFAQRDCGIKRRKILSHIAVRNNDDRVARNRDQARVFTHRNFPDRSLQTDTL